MREWQALVWSCGLPGLDENLDLTRPPMEVVVGKNRSDKAWFSIEEIIPVSGWRLS